MTKQTKDRKTDRFMEMVGIVRDWFNHFEGIDITDQVVGRMAVRVIERENKAHQEGYKEAVEEVKQLTINLKVNINSNVDTRTMEYRAYLQRKGHNGALTIIHDSLNSHISELEGKEEI